MSDNNKYVNLYIENTLGLVHQYLNDILQLKTQNKILTDLVSEKDQVIEALQDNLNKNTTDTDEILRVKANVTSMEDLEAIYDHGLDDLNHLKDVDADLVKQLENYAYDALLNDIEDWYNNEGGFGDLCICVPSGKYIINNHVRITETEDYFHDGSLLDEVKEK